VYANEESLLFDSRSIKVFKCRGDSVNIEYKKHRAWAENLSIVIQIGLTMAGCVGFCFFVGLTLDRWLGIRGLFTVLFILLGIAGGANVVYRQIMDIIEPKK
jgi:F0F1-type ATP synthase assembly protein I